MFIVITALAILMIMMISSSSDRLHHSRRALSRVVHPFIQSCSRRAASEVKQPAACEADN